MTIITFISIWFVFALVGGWRFYAWKNESREGITLEERNETFGARNFEIRMRTLDFVLINFLTGNFLYIFFCYDMARKLKKQYPGAGFMPFVVLLGIALMMWNAIFLFASYDFMLRSVAESAFDSALLMNELSSFIFTSVTVTELVILLLVSISSKRYIERWLEAEGLACPMNMVLCLIFPVFYHYHCIRNAEERHKKIGG